MDRLWIQRIDNLEIKPVKGKDNPADLGTMSLTRDKIKKYMVTIGYIGKHLDTAEVPREEEEEEVEVRRTRRQPVDEERLKRIIQAVTMAVMVALGEAHSTEEEQENQGLSFAMSAMVMMLTGCALCKLKTLCATAVRLKKVPPGRREKKRKRGEERRKKMKKRGENG